MDKFLNLCFKFGKWFMALVLVILLIVGIYLGVNAIQSDLKADDYKMDYQASENGLASLGQQKQSQKQSAGKKAETSYNEEIVKAFGDNKPTDKFTNIVSKYIDNNVEERDVKDFISNLPAYYDSVKQGMFDAIKKEYKATDAQLAEMYKQGRTDFDNGILEKYAERYQANVKLRASHKAEAITARNASLMALLVVLSMFIVTLIVPVLIKIEENTRR